MSQNKFLHNLNHKGSPPVNAPTSSPSPDPVQRLGEELSRQNQVLERLSGLIEQWGQRPAGATHQQLTGLVETAREGVTYSLDSATIAQLLLDALHEDMPSVANVKAAMQAAVSELQAAGQAQVDQLRAVSEQAVSQIAGASRQQAHSWVQRIGFINWQSALLMWGLLVALGGSLIWYEQSQEAERQAMRVQDKASREFVGWIQAKYPLVWKVYLKKVAPSSPN